MHTPLNPQKGGTKFSGQLHSLELEQETESDTLLLIQRRRYSLPYNYLRAAVNEWQNEHLDVVLLTCAFVRGVPALPGDTPLCQSSVPFTTQALYPSREPKAFYSAGPCMQNSSEEGWTWIVKSGIPLIFVLLGEVEGAWLLREQHYITCMRQPLMLSASLPSLGMLQPWLLPLLLERAKYHTEHCLQPCTVL